MFLRATKRFKDGKVHYYWSMVENVRVGRRVFRIARGEAEPPKAVARGVRQALYLGELNDSQREEWQRAVEALDEKGNVRQLKLFPEDRAPETDDGQVVRIRMDRLAVRNVRNWGEVWLGRELWDKLGLDGFWASRLGPSRKGTDWQNVQEGVDVKMAKADDVTAKCSDGKETTVPGDTFVLTRSAARSLKETSMRVKRIRSAMKTLFRLDERIGRMKWRKAEPSRRELTRDELIQRLAVAGSKAGGSWKMISITVPGEGEKVTPETFKWKLDWDRIREARANDEGGYFVLPPLDGC